MALVAHTIRSRDKPVLALNNSEVELVEEDAHTDDHEWELPIAGPSRLPPRFIRAKVIHAVDENSQSQGRHNPSEANTSAWYRQLTANSNRGRPLSPNLDDSSTSSTPNPSEPADETPRPLSLSNVGGDWFSLPLRPTRHDRTGVESIADQLVREPPSNAARRVPVWIALHPSNRGYQMVSKSGWNEGEGLGARQMVQADPNVTQSITIETNASSRENLKEVIDLTELESDDEDEFPSDPPLATVSLSKDHSSQSVLPSGGIALLTPIPTTLKSDRLGIGFNPKYVTDTAAGIRIPKRQVTHSQQALTEHAKSTEATRKLQQRWGRGKRGHFRRHKVDTDARRRLLAYMNA